MTAARATHWRLRTRTLTFDRLPAVMGVLNVTPDSFSDGGRFFGRDTAVAQGRRLVEEGAAIVDVGGESTRPGAAVVPEEEEMARTIPVVEALVESTNAAISIDTAKAAVAAAAVEAGAEVVNDVTGLTGDPEMAALVAKTGVGVCVMHMRGTPRTMQDDPRYDDVLAEVRAYLEERRARLIEAGVEADQIAIDPGIGFGKTVEHNLTLLGAADQLCDTGAPVVVGHSRKSFIGRVLGDLEADRGPGTIGVSLALARRGVHVLRVHDVAATRHALTLFDAAGGLG